MKKIFGFDVIYCTYFSVLLKKGIRAYATDKDTFGLATTLWLLLMDGLCLRIRSELHDLDDWNEIGTLVFQVVEVDAALQFIDLPLSWMEIVSIEALIFDSEEFAADCGIILNTSCGDSLIVLPGADVYTLAIQAPFFSAIFSPENNISRYIRQLLCDGPQ